MTTQELRELLQRFAFTRNPELDFSACFKTFDLRGVEFIWIDAAFFESLPPLYQQAIRFKNVVIGPFDALLQDLSAIDPETNWPDIFAPQWD